MYEGRDLIKYKILSLVDGAHIGMYVSRIFSLHAVDLTINSEVT